MKCPKCNAEASGSGRFCRSCGAPLAAEGGGKQESSACPSCGLPVSPGAKFCAACATPLASAPPSPPVAAVAVAICRNCGAQAKAGTKFCPSCGKPIAAGAPPVTPDLAPTAVIATPVRPAPAAPPPALPAQPAAPPPRMEHPPVPKPLPKAPPAGPSPVSGAESPSSSNRILVIAGVAVLALIAAGATYWFVVRKPAASSASVGEAVTPAQPAASEPVASGADSIATDSQASTAGEAEQPPDAAAAGTTPAAGNDAAAGSAAPVSGAAPKRTPAKPAVSGYIQAHKSAEQALAASQFLNPPDSSALFWARKAKALGDPEAAQLEQQVYAQVLSEITGSRQSHSYDQARAQLYQLATSFPDHTELRQMQDDIHQEQQRYTQQLEEQRRQAEVQTQVKKFGVQHRHGTGNSFCTGMITIAPDGTGRYDCSTADSGGRCEHVTFAMGSLKEVKVRGDGSLHVATRQSGNFDFSGSDGAIKDAAAALGPLVRR